MSWLSEELRRARWRVTQKYFHNFVFIHIPKNAGTSVLRALGLTPEHKKAVGARGVIGEQRWERKFKFAFVRNPWDRAVSSFHYARFGDSRFVSLSFSEWLHLAFVERHPLYFDIPHTFITQFDWICDRQDKVIIDFVGRFENIQQDFAVICKRIGRPNVVLPHRNRSKHEDYRNYYRKDKDIEIIANWYKKDIDSFGYTFDPPASLPRTDRTTESPGVRLKELAV